MKTIDSIISVCAPSGFLQLVEQERARVNRSGSNFTLILLEMADGTKTSKEARGDIFNAIMERIRNIDQVGFYDEDHIGLLLPQTGHDGATRIIDDLWRNKKITGNVTSYRLYCYP